MPKATRNLITAGADLADAERRCVFPPRFGDADDRIRCAGVGWASAEGPLVATGITQDAGNDTFRI